MVSASSSARARIFSLMMRPGEIALTQIPSSPSSRAKARVKAMIAPLDET